VTRPTRILAAAWLALWAGQAAAALSDPNLGETVTPKPASPTALIGVIGGWRLRIPSKSPLILPGLGALNALYPLKEAAVYGGLTVTWRSSARLFQLQSPSGRTARLVLDDPWLYDGSQRLALPRSLSLAAGAPAVDEPTLRFLLQRLCQPAPAFEAATPDELAAARLALAPNIVAAEPTLAPTQEPEIVPTQSVNVAARPLSGGPIRTIYLDAGHGGEDPGAHGPRRLKEKDVCLDIVLRLRDELKRQQPDLNVYLTRSRDEFITLRDRTELANRADDGRGADLFISIHNNAARDKKSHGTQVFFYDSQTSDRAAADLVAREEEDANQLDILFTDLAKSLVRDQSIRFGDYVQGELTKELKLKKRALSYAPFYVLARTKMPAILVEVAFITNPSEEKLLGSADFRDQVASAISRGVRDYRNFVKAQK
jgi:N-acetylmuramoyl-L-alanine amidase